LTPVNIRIAVQHRVAARLQILLKSRTLLGSRSKPRASASFDPHVPKPLSTKPYRTVLLWQAVATLAIAGISGLVAGGHGALSAVLGGVVNLSAGVVFAFVLAVAPPRTAGGTITAMFRAEGAKILVIVALLWLVLSTYRDAVLPAFLAAFVVTVLLSSVALFVRE
jgi:ATP synthase protein I